MVVLGDSNSSTYFTGFGQGRPWPELMASELATRFPDVKLDLINAAEFGQTSAGVLANLERDCLARKPDVVLLMIGTNDPSNGIPLQQTVANVREILKRVGEVSATDGGSAKAVLAQPPVAQSKHVADTAGIYELWCPYDESEDPSNSLKPMKEAYRRLADELGVAFVPVWDSFAAEGYDGSQPVRSEFLFDGLHLSAQGQALVARWMADGLVRVW